MTRNITRQRAAKIRAATIGAALLALALVGIAGPASAHVTVSSTDAAQGGFGKMVFRVPSESETASTTKLVVTLPKETPFSFISAGVTPGWKVDIAKEKLDKPTKVGSSTLTEAVRTVTWTATGDGIPPSQFAEFALSGGPFPDVKAISFSAAQTYSDGEIVNWDQAQEGEVEPEHPAPTLTLAAGAVDRHGTQPAAEKESDDDGGVIWLSGAALVVAVAALVVALRENRRRA